MIDRAMLDQVDEAIKCFEDNWSAESRANIHSLLAEFNIVDDYDALTDLVRIDIELRYERGMDCQIDDYFRDFSVLREIPSCASKIAFEDYRARVRSELSVPSSRWQHVPGVKSEIWFQQLEDSARKTRLRNPIERKKFECDPAFEAALEESGFQLVQEIGEGALSRVYLATQLELAERYVVLKVVNLALAEPQSMALLQHTNIVPIYSFHRILSRSVICMPYAGSVTLEDFLGGAKNRGSRGGESLIDTVQNRMQRTTIVGQDPPADADGSPAGQTPAAEDGGALTPLEKLRSLGCNDLAIWIFQRLASALAHSHARGVLHGDLKPGNVLIRNDGEPALLDFNLSQSLDRPAPQLAGGTLPYMSPETFRALMGQQISLQGSSDIYSLGVMLFEFLTGRLPYPTPKSIAPIDLQPAINIRKEPADWRPQDDLSPGLRAIVDRCLAYAPQDRYASAEDLEQDLQCEREHLALAHAREPRYARVKKWTRRHPRAVSGGSVGLLLLALLIPVGLAAIAYRSDSARLAALRQFESFSAQSAETLSTMMVDPRRHEEVDIQAALEPLQQYGVLDGSGLDDFRYQSLSDQQRAVERDTMLRHILHVALAETDRLDPASKSGALDDDQLARLDRLIAAAEAIRGDYQSRSLMMLRCKRAQLAGDGDLAAALRAEASQIKAATDSEIYLEAVRMMVDRQWPKAMELLTALADRQSVPSTLRWTMLARSQYNAGRFEDAKLSLTQAIERAPNNARLRYMRGLCYAKLRQFSRAESDYSFALERAPAFVAAWLNRGRCRVMQDEFDEAIADFSQGLELAPKEAELLLNRSEAYKRQGQLELAERDLEAAVKTTNVSAVSLRSRAAALMTSDPGQAADDLQRAFQLDPENPSALTSLARIYSTQLGDADTAIDVLTQALEIDDRFETALIDRAVLYAQQRQYKAAMDDLEQALQPPNFNRTLYQAACVFARTPGRENHELALTYLSRALQRGYKPDKRLIDDEDLASLRGTREFQSILQSFRMGNRPGLQQQQFGNDG